MTGYWWLLNVFINVFLNFEGNSDIERYQMANKKIPFKYARPVEEWLQEKGNLKQAYFHACVFIILLVDYLYNVEVRVYTENIAHCHISDFSKFKIQNNLYKAIFKKWPVI